MQHTHTHMKNNPNNPLLNNPWATLLSRHSHFKIEMLREVLVRMKVLYPQLSGVLFVAVHQLTKRVRPGCFLDYRNSDAHRLANRGLALSSLLYWNYVVHYKYKRFLYNLLCAFDYVMIASTTMVSTFPQSLQTSKDWIYITSLFALDTLRHHRQHNEMNSYRTHHVCCILSTFVAVYRSVRSRIWSPILLRLYSTSVCSLIFYLSFGKLHTVKQFRQMRWYLPWIWHLHATICQQTSIEIAYHDNQRTSTHDQIELI